MRFFFVFSLAFLIFVVVILSHVPDGLALFKHLEIGRVANMKSGELNDSNAVEVDGIRFETLVPESVLTVPNSQPETNINVEFGIRITNNTSNPWRFNFHSRITPELLRADGQVVQPVFLRIRRRKPKEIHFPLVMPGESATFFPDVILLWSKHGQLNLSIAKSSGGRWNFDVFNPGTYQFRFTYKNEMATETIQGQSQEWADTKLLEGFWTGVVFTPFVEFRLI
ncbi:hypothetical protein ACE1CI_31525 [Aerosakkonemataceae cyanobacterium BLCC-F50]|uniref:Uncharacterized protein n=1 Tax=Floridaenema flaviceps BLCC-F50 TaxID=3153642 RepID=A0ABV4Y0L7_9CYAN